MEIRTQTPNLLNFVARKEKMNLHPYTAFGQTKNVPVKIYIDAKFTDNNPSWDEVIWIERGEDWYAFDSMKGKRVRVITPEDWKRSKLIERNT